MALPLDAGARLAEGGPAVDDLAEYVLACRRLGYHHQDLTMHPTQVRDWYDRDAGLDLRALDADCAALAAVAAAAEDAARTQTDLVAELSGAWSGGGAAAAREFTWRSGRAATSVGSALRGAADALAILRDELWHAVDAKVATVQAIDGRHRAQREEWLAAARTVTTGVGDRAAASELVDQHVTPFVANDVGSDFVGAMRAAIAAIGAAYDTAIAGVSGATPAVFDVPGELGPRPSAGGGTAAATATTPAAAVSAIPTMAGIPSAATTFDPSTAPVPGAAWAVPTPTGSPPAVDPATGAPPAPPASALPAASAMPSAPSMPPMGELGGGVSGFGQQLADLIGSLVGSAGGAEDVGGPDGSLDELDDRALDDPDDPDDPDEEGDPDDPDEEESDDELEPEDGLEATDEADEAGEAESTDAAAETPSEPTPEPTPVPPPPPAVPPAVPEAVVETEEPTACEIAADAVPQVGE